MLRPLTVPVAGRSYSIRQSPEPLPDGADSYIDHGERVIWISPTLLTVDYPATYAMAVAQAWAERADLPLLHSTELAAPGEGEGLAAM